MMTKNNFKILAAALLLSLCANVYFGGAVLGDRAGGWEGRTAGAWKEKKEEFEKKFSEADRAVLKQAREANKPRMKELRGEMKKASRTVREVMRAEKSDAAALEAAMVQEARAKAKMASFMRDSHAETVKKLSPEGQATMKEMKKSWKKKHDDRRGGFDGDRKKHEGSRGDRPPHDGGSEDRDGED